MGSLLIKVSLNSWEGSQFNSIFVVYMMIRFSSYPVHVWYIVYIVCIVYNSLYIPPAATLHPHGSTPLHPLWFLPQSDVWWYCKTQQDSLLTTVLARTKTTKTLRTCVMFCFLIVPSRNNWKLSSTPLLPLLVLASIRCLVIWQGFILIAFVTTVLIKRVTLDPCHKGLVSCFAFLLFHPETMQSSPPPIWFLPPFNAMWYDKAQQDSFLLHLLTASCPRRDKNIRHFCPVMLFDCSIHHRWHQANPILLCR